MAAVKALAAATYVETAALIAGPPTVPGDAAGQEMAVRAEVACVLTIGERAAGALLHHSLMLTTRLPLTLAALQAGTISWQHARVMVEEADTLDPAGAAAL
ncbi:13E12 repeat family protein, partial [Arthrobacter sp. HMWF013]|uniref:13E12 repeat family protein n=1 Tax=Arthrobacter sp. HMWF013 TaxID=2056849 RepID=UPI002159E1BC